MWNKNSKTKQNEQLWFGLLNAKKEDYFSFTFIIVKFLFGIYIPFHEI